MSGLSFAENALKRLMGKAIHNYRMIEPGERILVGLSGGKDSIAMLDFMHERLKRSPVKYELVACHLSAGYENEADLIKLTDFVKNMGVSSHFEWTDHGQVAHSKINRANPCFLCSRMRRRRLFELAQKYNCKKVALGHHRDDMSETLLMNIIYSGEISTMQPVQPFFNGLLTIIRPLCMAPEDKIVKTAVKRNYPIVANYCPSSERSKRNRIKGVIAELARENDKVRGNIYNSLSNWNPEYLLSRSGQTSSNKEH